MVYTAYAIHISANAHLVDGRVLPERSHTHTHT